MADRRDARSPAAVPPDDDDEYGELSSEPLALFGTEVPKRSSPDGGVFRGPAGIAMPLRYRHGPLTGRAFGEHEVPTERRDPFCRVR